MALLSVKETMTDEDLAECRRVIFAIMSLEQKGETLPSPLNQQPLNTRYVPERLSKGTGTISLLKEGGGVDFAYAIHPVV